MSLFLFSRQFILCVLCAILCQHCATYADKREAEIRSRAWHDIHCKASEVEVYAVSNLDMVASGCGRSAWYPTFHPSGSAPK